MTMSSLQPSGYKFGCTYVGTKQYSPSEASQLNGLTLEIAATCHDKLTDIIG